jgi:site-specific DNA recombinase
MSCSKSAVRAIIRNPRYSGFQVWNRQSNDEVLLDVNDVALGHTSVQRRNQANKWVTSADVVHRPLVDQDTFDRVQRMLPTRGPRSAKPSRAKRSYMFKGLMYCGVCDRKKQGHHSRGAAYYRAGSSWTM